MEIAVWSSNDIDPADVAKVLEEGGYYVRSVSVNDRTRVWEEDSDEAPWRPNS